MVNIEFTKEFQIIFSKIKDSSLKLKIIKQLKKLKENPEVGKPMRNLRKGTRELYIKPFRLFMTFRLSYSYLREIDTIYLLDIYHKKNQ